MVKRAQQKIDAIRRTRESARGLTVKEADIAARVGLIDADQQWWWTEEWQKGERQADKDRKMGRTKVFRMLKRSSKTSANYDHQTY